MNPKIFKILGWIATFTAMLMYVSYFPQIINNIHGHKSSFLQPTVAAINCILWVSYGFFSKEKRLADCGDKSSRCSFRCYSCGYSSITDDFQT